MKECSKSILRRLQDVRFATRWLVGSGVDIGGKPDPLAIYKELFPGITAIKTWDWEDGDAQVMAGVADNTFDFVFSSHCLEHLVDPAAGLATWLRVVKPGGHIVVTIPDEDLYEQGVWPSTHNLDHKHTFSIWKAKSWSPASINVMDLLASLGASAEICRVEKVDAAYRYELPRFDQTLSPVAECAIEFIIRKRPAAEIAIGGRLPTTQEPSADMRIHFNQYRNDMKAMKRSNESGPPFTDTTPLIV